MRAAAYALLVSAVVSCVLHERASERVRREMKQLEPRQLSSCLGDPFAHEITPEREDLLFLGTRRARIGVARDMQGGQSGFVCTYRVRVEGRRVTSVEARGYTADGLTFDHGCLIELRHCFGG